MVCARSLIPSTNTNCIIPESVKTTDLFDSTVCDHKHEDPEEIVFLESFIEVLEKVGSKLVNDFVSLTMSTVMMNLDQNDSTSTTIK